MPYRARHSSLGVTNAENVPSPMSSLSSVLSKFSAAHCKWTAVHSTSRPLLGFHLESLFRVGEDCCAKAFEIDADVRLMERSTIIPKRQGLVI